MFRTIVLHQSEWQTKNDSPNIIHYGVKFKNLTTCKTVSPTSTNLKSL